LSEQGRDDSAAAPLAALEAPDPSARVISDGAIPDGDVSAGDVSAGEITDEDLAVFLDMSTELFGVFDPSGGIAWSNAAAAAALGYSPEELQGLSTADLIHPDDVVASAAALGDLVGGGEPAGVEMRYRCKDGTWNWIEWTARMAPDTGLVYGVGRDVTPRHEARAALRANEAFLRAILDYSKSAIWVKDRLGRYVLVNDAFARPFDMRAEDIVGKSAHELWPDSDIDDVDATVVQTGAAITRDDVIDLPTGLHTVMTVRFPLRDASDDIVGVAGIATDITERTRAERALAERQRLLETVIGACPDIVTVLDRRGRVREVSHVSAEVLGYDLDDAAQEDLEALIHPDDLPAVIDRYASLFVDPGAPPDVRYRVRHSDGHWVVLDTRAHVMLGDDGAPDGAVVVSRDITGELGVESELRASVDAAEEASRAKSEFLSRMSHELRTPLNAVLGFAQLLEMDELPVNRAEAVGHVVRAGRHLLDLVDEIPDIAHIESGNLELSIGAEPVLDVVGDAVDLSRPLAEVEGVGLVLESACSPATYVLADRQRLLQVFLNLLSNAVKYNHRGGLVRVIVELAPDHAVRVTVADTGVGIAPEEVHRLFAPFDRLGAEHSGIEGTGMGLMLSKHLVEHMGGSIYVQSALGEGAAFTIELPATSAPERADTDVPASSESAGVNTSLRVLHVEDDLANLELVEQVLARAGVVHLFAAMSGALGLELAREHRPDLVLLDLHLPDGPGLELLRQLRSDPRTADITVVVISADATPEQMQRATDSGAAAYLTKPVDVRDLLDVVVGVSARRSGSS